MRPPWRPGRAAICHEVRPTVALPLLALTSAPTLKTTLGRWRKARGSLAPLPALPAPKAPPGSILPLSHPPQQCCGSWSCGERNWEPNRYRDHRLPPPGQRGRFRQPRHAFILTHYFRTPKAQSSIGLNQDPFKLSGTPAGVKTKTKSKSKIYTFWVTLVSEHYNSVISMREGFNKYNQLAKLLWLYDKRWSKLKKIWIVGVS